jgi:hypothetical protein
MIQSEVPLFISFIKNEKIIPYSLCIYFNISIIIIELLLNHLYGNITLTNEQLKCINEKIPRQQCAIKPDPPADERILNNTELIIQGIKNMLDNSLFPDRYQIEMMCY